MAIGPFRDEYRFLSNFHPSAFEYRGHQAATVEHHFQAAKTLQEEEVLAVLACKTPGQAKRAGRRVTLRPDWDEVKDSIMGELLREKFKLSELRDLLLATGEEPLVEVNLWHDNYWGVCACKRCGSKLGANRLGLLLQEVREQLRGGS